MSKRTSFHYKLMSYLSYKHKYFMVTSIGLLGYALLIYVIVSSAYNQVHSLNVQIAGNQFEHPLRQLMEHLPRHQVLSNRFLNGDIAVRGDLITTQNKITDNFRKLITINKNLGNPLQDPTFFSTEDPATTLDLEEISKAWDGLSRQIFDLTPAGNEAAHNQLLRDIRSLIESIGNASILGHNFDIVSYYNLEMTLIKLPEVQQLLSSIMYTGEATLKRGELTNLDKGNLLSDIVILQNNLQSSLSGVGKLYQERRREENGDYIFSLYTTYVETLENYVRTIKRALIYTESPKISLEEFLSDSQEAAQATFAYWDGAIDELNYLLTARKNSVIKWYTGIIVASVSFLIFSFFLGLYFIRWLNRQLSTLEEEINRFAQGDLQARSPVYYEDLAGRLSASFNGMANHFEKVLEEISHLTESIKKLAAGDFTTRLEVLDHQSEMGMVFLAFNQMAQNFGGIVSQLRELGINLATSATQITAASKQQELIITEQEATTREISVTANEIATTAQEFANTMNEVSHVAEQTANLAGTGKESLTHMESIMRVMVEASQNIASKLAVLNEKASNITSVITTITKVADQTNLLSLNASIEAEKAGEYGKSFAVIAREIRRLADLTAFATLDIEKIVSEIMSAVSTSVMGVDDFTQEIRNGVDEVGTVVDQLTTIIDKVQMLTNRFESVNQGMQSQAVGAEQINDAIAQLNHSARETSSSLSGFRQTLQGLTIAASDLKTAVDTIKKESLTEDNLI